MLELTVPWEERIEEANERTRATYQELVEECRERGWRTFIEPIEVGCRGFAGRSLCKVLSRLGVTGVAKKRAIQSASEAAEKATRWLWIKRADPWAATGTQVRAWSTPAGSPGRGCMMLRDPKHPMIPGYITEDASQCIYEMFLA